MTNANFNRTMLSFGRFSNGLRAETINHCLEERGESVPYAGTANYGTNWRESYAGYVYLSLAKTPFRRLYSQRACTVVLKYLHDDPLGGHFGVEKTLDRVRERYYWHNFTVDTTEFIRTCDTCQRRTGPKPTPRAMLESFPVGGPFEMVAMDILE